LIEWLVSLVTKVRGIQTLFTTAPLLMAAVQKRQVTYLKYLTTLSLGSAGVVDPHLVADPHGTGIGRLDPNPEGQI
jgi:hypothetical protein